MVWLGHIQKVGMKGYPNECYYEKTPDGQRNRGCPRKRWIDGVTMEIKEEERGLDEDLCYDREQW